MARIPTEAEVVAYFRGLTHRELRDNEALREAARAMHRLQKRHGPGPGRPPSIPHTGRKDCPCANCRRDRFPSYSGHKPYQSRYEVRRTSNDEAVLQTNSASAAQTLVEKIRGLYIVDHKEGSNGRG